VPLPHFGKPIANQEADEIMRDAAEDFGRVPGQLVNRIQ
jgi:hypothetical protein